MSVVRKSLTLPGLGIRGVEFIAEVDEVLESVLLPETHELGIEALFSRGWHLVDLEPFLAREEASLGELDHVGALETFPV